MNIKLKPFQRNDAKPVPKSAQNMSAVIVEAAAVEDDTWDLPSFLNRSVITDDKARRSLRNY